ncbi:MAG: type II CRISPR RNA-guided endonuclease Cas9 [Alphaproteobacteria bacterium]
MYKLGIDIGTNSIGWAVVEIKRENDKIIPLNLIDFGVRIFNNGLTQDTKPKSLASVRSEAKGARVNQDRYLVRRKKLFDLLVSYGFMPNDKSEQKSLEILNPYKCRAECVKGSLKESELIQNLNNPLYILGRALFHINQHRGFQSLSEDNTSKWEDAHKKLIEEIKNNDCKTLGEYQWKMIKNGEKVRFRGAIDDNGKLKKDEFPSRDIYKQEIKSMFEIQRKFFPELTEEMEKEITDIILDQNNLKKQEPAKCLFDDKPNIQLAQILFQKFRIVSEVRNLEIIYPENKKLSDEDRRKLIDALYNCNTKLKSKDNVVSYLSIKEFLGLDVETLFNFEATKKYKYKGKNEEGKAEYEDVYKPLLREGIKCSETNNILYSEIKNWNSFSDTDKFDIIEILTDYSKFAKDRVKSLKEQYNIEFDNIKVNEILNKLPKGYCKLSKDILEKIIPLMENDNLKYHEALEKIEINHSLKEYQKEGWIPLTNLPYYTEKFKEYLGRNGRITNPVVHIALNQLRIVVNEIIALYGNPEVIGIEVARDMAQGDKTKAKIAVIQSDNKKINDEARRAIISQGENPSDYNIEKYKVWRNLCPHDETKRIDIYNIDEVHPIPLSELFSPKYEIEHILPFSKSGDDSYANKIITKSKYNGEKCDRTPSEWKTNEPEELKLLQKRAGFIDFYRKDKKGDKSALKGNNKKRIEYKLFDTWWRFLPNAMDIYNKLTGGLNARDINDTRYITKLTNQYLNYVSNDWKHNTVNTGIATDLYRNAWQLLRAVPRDFDLWIPQKWQQDFLSDKLKDVILFLHPEYDKKDMQKEFNSKVAEIIDDLIDGNPTKYNNLVDEFEKFVINQSNEIGDVELLNKNEKDVKTPIIKRNAFDIHNFQFVKVETENLSSDEIKKNCHQLFYNLSSKQKDRAIHYHHAIDAIVCACLDTALVQYPNSEDFRKEVDRQYYEGIKGDKNINEARFRKSLKESLISEKLRNENKENPYKNFDMNELKERFRNMFIFYKEETNKVKYLMKGIREGKNKSNLSFLNIMKGTAYSIENNNLTKDDNVTFKKFNRSKGKVETEISNISSMIPVFRNKEQKKIYLELFDKYFIGKQRLLDGKITQEEFDKTKKLFEESFTKDKAYKWYASDGNYEAQIYMVDGKWQMEILNRFRVFEHLEDKNGYALWNKIYPNAKKIMTLRANDIVKVNINKDKDLCDSLKKFKNFIDNRFLNTNKESMDFYFKVKKMTGDTLYLRPLHIAQEDNGDKKTWQCNFSTKKGISVAQQYNIKKVYLNALGKEINNN